MNAGWDLLGQLGQAYRQYILREFGRAFDVSEEEGDCAGG
jgi:hypothetical protein